MERATLLQQLHALTACNDFHTRTFRLSGSRTCARCHIADDVTLLSVCLFCTYGCLFHRLFSPSLADSSSTPPRHTHDRPCWQGYDRGDSAQQVGPCCFAAHRHLKAMYIDERGHSSGTNICGRAAVSR
jgi:hypothetical protein